MTGTSCKGLVGLVINGYVKLGYRRFDPQGNPGTLGNEIIHFILSLNEQDILNMKSKVEAIEWTENWIPCDQERGLLERIWEGQTQVAEIPSSDTAAQMCDYAYHIDFENRRVETQGAWFGERRVWPFEEIELGCFS